MKRSPKKAPGAVQETEVPGNISQEEQERAPSGWHEVQQSVAESSGISLLLVQGHQPPALAVSNNNSICNALQSSPRHVGLCDPFCGEGARQSHDGRDDYPLSLSRRPAMFCDAPRD
jgi:hypothetical protein